MPYTLYVVLLVILGISLLIGLLFLAKKLKIKLLPTAIIGVIVCFVIVIVTDLSLKGSKLFIINPDLTLKTTIIFSDQEFTFFDGTSVIIKPNLNSYFEKNKSSNSGDLDRNSYIINNSKSDYYIDEIKYGYKYYKKIEDPLVETLSFTKVPFRRLSYFGNEKPIESITVSRGSGGDIRYWLRKANKEDLK